MSDKNLILLILMLSTTIFSIVISSQVYFNNQEQLIAKTISENPKQNPIAIACAFNIDESKISNTICVLALERWEQNDI